MAGRPGFGRGGKLTGDDLVGFEGAAPAAAIMRKRCLIPKKSTAMLAIIIVLNTLPALATDMYLAALPDMSVEFGSPVGLLNLNLILFFLFYGIGLLIWGPLSDRYGRRPTLIAGMSAFVIFSVLCGFAGSVYELIAFRALQGVFGGVAVAVSVAMVKEVYDGRERERAFAVVSIMMALGPILAPIVGATLLNVMSWRGIFFVLAGLGAVALSGCVLMEETLRQRSDRRLLATLGQLLVVVRNRRYSRLLPSLSLLGMVIFVWVGVSTYILIQDFGLSQEEFSMFFAGNAFFFLVGPFLYLFLARHIDRLSIITACLALVACSGFLVIIVGGTGPVAFLLSVIPATLAVSVTRTPSLDIVMSQMDMDIGSASSMFNFLFMAIGAIGMMVASLGWEDRTFVVGTIFVIIGLVSLFSWLLVYRDYSGSRE